MDIKVNVIGLDRLDKATKAAQESIVREMLIGLDASARQVANEAKKSIMAGDKSGREYKRRTVTHRASAPGEAPANDTGRLVNSISTYLIRDQGEAQVVAGRGLAKYAAMLEFGTVNMAARPFMFPAAERSRKWINDRLNKAMVTALKKVAKK